MLNKIHGPRYEGAFVLPLADAPRDNMIVEFHYWDDKWMWTVYYCVFTSDSKYMDINVYDENGVIHETREEFKA